MNLNSVWKRRIALMAVVGVVIALPVTLAIRGGEDEGDEGGVLGGLTPAALPLPQVGPGAEDRDLAVSYRVPRGWSEEKAASAVRLRSEDRSAELVVAAPAPAEAADEVLDEALTAIREGYDDVEVSPGSGRDVGGLEAEGAVVSATAGGVPLRIVIAVARGEERAYLVEVFTTSQVAAESLREAQVALNSLRLEG